MVSIIKSTGLELLNVIDKLAKSNIKHETIKKFWDWFFVGHARQIILNKPDNEIREALKVAYIQLKPIFEQEDLAISINQAERLYDTPKIQRIGEMKKVMSLIEDLGL